MATRIEVTPAPACPGTISPFQYGQFIEYYANLVPAMWAEKLYDGSFEGLTPYRNPFIAQTDFREKPWYPSGQVNRAQYRLDPEDPVSGDFAQKIATVGATPCTVGLSQDGISLEAGKSYLFSCFLRHAGDPRDVQVRLHQEGKVYANCEFQPTVGWTKFRAELVPSADDPAATLSFSFHGPGTLWIDNASLMPRDTVGGWRPDVVQALREVKPGIVRFGGNLVEVGVWSADDHDGVFRWRDSLGDPDRRRPFRAVGGLQPTGPGLEEIVQLIQAVGAEALICVKTRNTSPQDAAEEVEYFNGDAGTPMGKIRAANGHPEPYGIIYWQVGNEQHGRVYEENLPEFCRLMKQADPAIRLLASYPSADVLRGAGKYLDYVAPHYYWCENIPGVEQDMLKVQALCQEHAPGRNIKIATTEWNTTAGDWGVGRGKLWTLSNALCCARYHNLMHRHCDIVEIANRSALANGCCCGIIQTDNRRLFKTPTYYAQQLYATLAGDRPLAVDLSDGPCENLDLSATLSRDGAFLVLFAINMGLEPLSCLLDVSALRVAAQEATVWTLADSLRAGEPDATNSFAEPERIATSTAPLPIAGPRMEYLFPALSLTVLRCRVAA